MTGIGDTTPTLATAHGNVPKVTRPSALRRAWRWRGYYLMLLPGILYFVVFHYLPIWQTKLAFQDYRIIGPSLWVGLKHFRLLFDSPVFTQVLWNTVLISAMKLVLLFPVPVIVALLVNEVQGHRYRRFVQSAIYLPHFLSWIVIAGVFIAVLSPIDGTVNDLLGLVGMAPIPFMTSSGSILWVLVVSEMWRSAGWDSLLFLAAIMTIDPGLYDAATIDGAGRWQKIRHVTLPALVPTMATVFILNLGGFMSAGFDQVFNFSNDAIRDRIDILDTYVYRMGIIGGEYAYATAAGLFKGVIGMAMILGAHLVSKRLTGKGVW
ncbi:putative aldouronate transport system permease protein [Inquilinus ginsengisoli]|uniref:Aldouronate transport system permease protein n=1 Tax=Inquilinus ginsengisoli TaxID=363840 RepID=A0ABU1JXK3_9PROT|nr:ABC transporter permease subunit [Inquilinus ginsengisoli]MDR6293357.1 putative aldouronate transport system permease protein [Inquilinus ginsengisoli]